MIGFDEFAMGLALLGVLAGEAQLRRLFRLVDSNHDGRITEQELVKAVRQNRLHPVDEDPLFADAAVDLPTLRQRAYNHRWAVHPPDVIPLTAADSDFPVSEEIMSAVHRYLEAGYLPYGPPEGLPELRRAAAARHARNGLRCDPDTILPTDGAASALFLAVRMLITAPGDEAIIPDPVDFLLSRSVGAAGGVVRRWPIRNGIFDVTELEALITPRTRLISVCNPHNPLGRVLRRDELEAIANAALSHRLRILSDEVWSDIVYPPHKHISIASLDSEVAARTFTVFGFSKSYALAGLRLGLLVAPDAAQRRYLMQLAQAGETAFGASTDSQIAGAAAYEHGGPGLRVSSPIYDASATMPLIGSMRYPMYVAKLPKEPSWCFQMSRAWVSTRTRSLGPCLIRTGSPWCPAPGRSSVPEPLATSDSPSPLPAASSPKVSTGSNRASRSTTRRPDAGGVVGGVPAAY
ncbi:aminotransferase class I/II-fold pyridoxal phosphate-dependent enzyme [Streptomyces sp. NPDC057910]|uniref:aminotransferase class I/II-fold pyridoxal phosphate-dependent enzyme n=1 Tax=Streptomyces sp. NPDC057910 TaxID=3346278 RepID=UPI0036E31B6B